MINSIQYLRGFAALLVVLYHASGVLISRFFKNETDYFYWGNAGVDLFFIISGFIMVYITYGRKLYIQEFFLKRAIRIYPIFWFYATMALIIFIINPSMINRSSDLPTLILPSYLLTPYTEHINLLPVAWTLVYEIHFYLIFAISLILSNKYRYIFAGLIISIAALSALFDYKYYYLSYITNPIILEFLLGMIIYFFIFKRDDKPTLVTLSFLFFFSISLLSANEHLPERVLYYGIPSFVLVLIIIYIDVVKLIGNGSGGIFKILKILGDSSYSIYLSHLFCIGAGSIILNKFNIANNFNGQILIFIITIGSVLWGIISYKFIENPLINKLNKMFIEKKFNYRINAKKLN